MRVAIFVVSLLGIASAGAGQAQIVSTAEGASLTGAVPTTAIKNPSLAVPDLLLPAGRQAALVRRAPAGEAAADSVVSVSASRLTAAHFASAGSVMGSPSARVGSSSSFTLPTPAEQARQPPVRTATDHLLAAVVAVMLIAYQLRRKHRVLRPHPFTT